MARRSADPCAIALPVAPLRPADSRGFGVRRRAGRGGVVVVSRWTAKVVAGVLLGMAVRAFAPTPQSEASHPFIPHQHIGSMNGVETENVCVEIADDSITFAFARQIIEGTLVLDNPSEDWNGLKSGRVDFFVESEPCIRGFGVIEMRYDVRQAPWLEECGPGSGICADWSDPYPDPVSGHDEYLYGRVYLTTSVLRDPFQYRRVIDHETGHVLGLKDGGPDYDGTECTGSIMHAYGCDNVPEWPSAEDRASVGALIWEPVASGPQCGRSPTWGNC